MLFSKYKSVLLLVLAIGMFLKPTSGFGQIEPAIEIEVQQRDGEVAFKFFIQDTILFFIRHRARIGVSMLYVNDTKEGTIWLIEMSNPDPAAVARELRYGVVPEGFSQRVPKQGDAPRLKNNAEYQVVVSWGGGAGGRTTFIYQGAKAP